MDIFKRVHRFRALQNKCITVIKVTKCKKIRPNSWKTPQKVRSQVKCLTCDFLYMTSGV